MRFETDDRYYFIEVKQDLLDDTVIVCHYGSKNTKRQHIHTYYVTSEAELNKKLEAITKDRYQHGYDLVESC